MARQMALLNCAPGAKSAIASCLVSVLCSVAVCQPALQFYSIWLICYKTWFICFMNETENAPINAWTNHSTFHTGNKTERTVSVTVNWYQQKPASDTCCLVPETVQCVVSLSLLAWVTWMAHTVWLAVVPRDRQWFITARRCAIAWHMLWSCVCLAVCLSHARIVSKWLNTWSRSQCCICYRLRTLV